ncbi:MAG: Uncharacterised protein [Crocinitomicaceae bacterium]|nr:MAG: Uncharacterised protein [Crocinitomicaceae bacterium]
MNTESPQTTDVSLAVNKIFGEYAGNTFIDKESFLTQP